TQQLRDDEDLRTDLIRRLVAGRDAGALVLGQQGNAELRTPVLAILERDVQALGLAIVEQSLDEVQEADDRVDQRAVRRPHLGHRVIGAVREARRVDEQGRYAGAAAKT